MRGQAAPSTSYSKAQSWGLGHGARTLRAAPRLLGQTTVFKVLGAPPPWAGGLHADVRFGHGKGVQLSSDLPESEKVRPVTFPTWRTVGLNLGEQPPQRPGQRCAGRVSVRWRRTELLDGTHCPHLPAVHGRPCKGHQDECGTPRIQTGGWAPRTLQTRASSYCKSLMVLFFDSRMS